MGLMSFLKSAGRKLGVIGDRTDPAAEAAAKQAAEAKAAAETATSEDHEEMFRQAVRLDIYAAIQSYVAITALDVSFDGHTAALTGTASTQADREKALLVAGNTEGVGAVDDGLTVDVPEPEATYHTVVKGDSLSKISAAVYGTPMLYDVIFDANRPMLEHPDRIYPGQVLRVPPRESASYTVRKGDTLGGIAKRFLGNPAKYNDIFEANRDVLSSPDRIDVGMTLRIP